MTFQQRMALGDPSAILSCFMTTPTPTPRTDKFVKSTNSFVIYGQLRASHEELERQLAEARGKLSEVSQELVETLTSKNTAVNKWADRLEEAEAERDDLAAKLAATESAYRQRIKDLETALLDCLSIFREDDKTTNVTVERQEAWHAILQATL